MNKQIKTVSICLSHKWNDGMAERILKVFPNVEYIKMSGSKCVACNGKV